MLNTLIQWDCLDVMKSIPDKSIDLILTDPPYWIWESAWKNKSRGKCAIAKDYWDKDWDDKIPDKEYFDEIFRISKNQIIFWGNYFVQALYNSPCWIVWDKNNTWDFADCELAWTSFTTAVRKFKFTWNGMIQEDMKHKEIRQHPTQKPKELMKWCIENYSQPWETILDCFTGSGTTWVAAIELWRNYILIEKDPDYCKIIERRLKSVTMPMFVM